VTASGDRWSERRSAGPIGRGQAAFSRNSENQGRPRRELGELELPQRGDAGDRLDGSLPLQHCLAHRAWTAHTRLEAHSARLKASASGIPLIDGHFRVRHDTIDSNDKLAVR
jgi:hypothetical protein